MRNLPLFMMILFVNLMFGQTKIAECIFNKSLNTSKNCSIVNSENQNFTIKDETLKIKFDENLNEAIFKIKANYYEDLALSIEFAEKPSSFQLLVSSNKKSWKEVEVDNKFTDLEKYKYFYNFENNKKWVYVKIKSKESSELILKAIKVFGTHDKEFIIPLPD